MYGPREIRKVTHQKVESGNMIGQQQDKMTKRTTEQQKQNLTQLC